MQHGFPFDPTYGYTREGLLAIAPPPAPADFDAFWRGTYAEAASVPLQLERAPASCHSARHRVEIVRFTVLGGHRVGAWLVTPAEGAPTAAGVVGHGYGGREAPDFERRQAALLYPCMPGFHLSAARDLPAQAADHVVHGIATRETYLLRACVAALWASAWVMARLFPDLGGRLRYLGASFGGGLGALALPWERSFVKAYLDVPTFGHHPIRLRCPCVGSGESVRLLVERQPAVAQVLPYYDAAVAATRIRIPTLVAAAHFDPAVPPPGQFAVYNALAGPRELFERAAAHFEGGFSMEEERRLRDRIDAFVWEE
jgi:cephalosporin-C deacetylase